MYNSIKQETNCLGFGSPINSTGAKHRYSLAVFFCASLARLYSFRVGASADTFECAGLLLSQSSNPLDTHRPYLEVRSGIINLSTGTIPMKNYSLGENTAYNLISILFNYNRACQLLDQAYNISNQNEFKTAILSELLELKLTSYTIQDDVMGLVNYYANHGNATKAWKEQEERLNRLFLAVKDKPLQEPVKAPISDLKPQMIPNIILMVSEIIGNLLSLEEDNTLTIEQLRELIPTITDNLADILEGLIAFSAIKEGK